MKAPLPNAQEQADGVSRIFGDDHHEGLARFTVDVIIQLKKIQLKYQT